MDQPGKVANPARGQLNRENEYYTPVIQLVLVSTYLDQAPVINIVCSCVLYLHSKDYLPRPDLYAPVQEP